MFWIITKWMKITEKQICEDQIVTFKQSHILLYQGLLFLTRSTCVIVDARSHTCKSHDFIPRYDIIPVTPTHPIERLIVAHELPVLISPEMTCKVNCYCHNDGNTDCDVVSGVIAFISSFASNLYDSFITSNYNHCTLVLAYLGSSQWSTAWKDPRKTIRLPFAYYNSSYLEILDTAGYTTHQTQRLGLIALIVFIFLHGLNSPCLNDLFTHKCVAYQTCDSSLLVQSRWRTTTFGFRSISHIGANIWDDLTNDF